MKNFTNRRFSFRDTSTSDVLKQVTPLPIWYHRKQSKKNTVIVDEVSIEKLKSLQGLWKILYFGYFITLLSRKRGSSNLNYI